MDLAHLSAILTRYMPILLDAAIKASVLLAAAWLATGRMRRWSAATRHVVLLAGLASLLVLPVLSGALPAWRVLPVSWDIRQVVKAAPSATAVAASPAIVEGPHAVPGDPNRFEGEYREPVSAGGDASGHVPFMSAAPPTAGSSLPAGPGLPAAPSVPVQASRFASPLGPWAWIGLVWMAGSLLLGLRLVVGLVCLLWASLRLPLCREEDWQAGLQQACRDLGIGWHVRLLQGRGNAMPMTWGIVWPHLLVPADAGAWSPQRRRVVLLHELAHVKRWDCLTQLVAEAACAVSWFNPLAWAVSKRMQNEAERACDDLVLQRGSKPAEYAEHLLQIAASQHQGYLAAAMAAIPMARASKLEGRLLAILDGKRSRRALTLGVVVMALVLVAGVVVPVAMLRAGQKAADAAKMNPAGPAIARLPGLTVEVVGVSYHPSKDKTWWGPDGTVGEQYAFVTDVGHVSGNGQQTREFVLLVKGEAAKDAGFRYDVESSGASGSGSVRPARGAADGHLAAMSATLPPSVKTATVKVGVAMGPWTTAAEGPAGGMSSRSSPTSSVVFGPALESGGGVAVTISYTPIEGQVRIVAIDKDGQEHTGQTSGGGSAGRISQTTAQFAGVSRSQIKSFRLQAREYQWITFRDISIEPGYKTDVQVEVEGDEASETVPQHLSDVGDARAPVASTLPVKEGAGQGDGIGSVIQWPNEGGHDVFVDLDAGRLCTPPRMFDESAKDWGRKNGMDALFEFGDSQILAGVDLTVLKVNPGAWNTGPTSADIVKLATDGSDPEHVGGLLPMTLLFRTREGSLGLLRYGRGVGNTSSANVREPAGVRVFGPDLKDPESLRVQYRIVTRDHATRPAGSGEPSLTTQSAASSQAADDGITVTGIVTDELGHPRANVQFGQRFPGGLIRGSESDGDGQFVLKGVMPQQKEWIAYSQATRRVALFTLPKDAGEKPIMVKLNLWEGQAEGRLVDANGHGVAKARVRLRVQTPEGGTFLSDALDTDKEGYYEIDGLMPVGEGLAVEVRTARDADAGVGWMHRTVLGQGQIHVEMPDLVAGDVEPKSGPASGSRAEFGGRVVDEQGKPIAGARVDISYEIPGQGRGLWSKNGNTDAEGRWTRRLPANMHGMFVRLYHPRYISGEDVSLPAMERLRDKSAEMVMKKGLRLSGTVRSPDGGSIEDALVLTQMPSSTTGGLGEAVEDGTMFRSGADGSFLADGLPAGQRSLTIYARGYSPRVVDVNVQPDLKPVEVVLEPGTKIRGQVVNTEGQGVAGARVNAEKWTVGEERPLPREVICDGEGWFELPDMPTQGTFTLYCSKRGKEYVGTNADELRYQKEPYHLTLYHPTEIEGQVVDDATGEPIAQFDLDRGRQYRDDKAPNFRSDDKKTIMAADGRFRVALEGWIVSAKGPGMCVRVQAPGYLAAETPVVPIGNRIEPVTLRLIKSLPIRGKVLDVEGKPLAGVQVYWVGLGQLALVENGQIDERLVAAPDTKVRTDGNGIFELPASKQAGVILVLDKTGYAMRKMADHDPDEPLRIVAWAKVEGMVKAGEKGEGGTRVALMPAESRDRKDTSPEVCFQLWQAAHTDGTFVFEKVPSMPLKASKVGIGFASHAVKITPTPGKTVRVEIGAGGGVVSGRIEKPEGPDMAAFADEFGLGKHYTRAIAYPASEASVPLEKRTVYAATLQADGSFQIHGLPAGSYVLDVSVHAPPQAGTCGVPVAIATGKAAFEIKANNRSEVPVPPIRLGLTKGPQPGQAVSLVGKTLSGEAFDLKQLRGKVVLVDVWASWCGPCRAAAPQVKQLWDKHGSSGKIAFVGVNCDRQLDDARKCAAEQGLGWPQVATESWGEGNAVLAGLGVTAIPSFWLVGADGTVLARDIPVESLAEQVERALVGREAQ